MLRALLIEDNPIDRTVLKALLSRHDDVRIVGEAETVARAMMLAKSCEYDVVFLDVQLHDGSGFEVVSLLHAGAKVVFTTVRDDHALRAFEVNALDYLVKPVVRNRLAETLRRVRCEIDPAVDVPKPEGAILAAKDPVLLRSGNLSRVATVSEITLIEAEENYTRVHLEDGMHLLVRRSLKSWEENLPAGQFMRVHRTMLVDLRRVEFCEKDGKGGGVLRVAGSKTPIPVSRQIWQELSDRLQSGQWVES